MSNSFIAPHFQSPEAAREWLEKLRWPEGPVCSHCGVINHAYRTKKPGWYRCAEKDCRKDFTVTTGTVMERSHIPLNKWLMAFYLLNASKKGMSAHQLHRMLKVTYRSAWFMAHRIRYTMTQEPLSSKLDGIVEIDETYIGGKIRKRNGGGIKTNSRGQDRISPVANKAAVFAVLQRGGRVQTQHVERVTAENLRPVVDAMVAEDAHVMTDNSTVLGSVFLHRQKHDTVNHFENEYARYEDGVCISTNTVEGYFGILKRGINGVYHHVGQQHLHRYLSEFDFRYNSRKETDSMRTVQALKSTTGKRLMLRDSRLPN